MSAINSETTTADSGAEDCGTFFVKDKNTTTTDDCIPKLIRGLTSTCIVKEDSMAHLIVTAGKEFDPLGWGSITDLKKIILKASNGFSGNATFKVTYNSGIKNEKSTENEDTNSPDEIKPFPSVLAFHSRVHERKTMDKLAFERTFTKMSKIGPLLHEKNVGVKWLARGSDWHIEEWEGPILPDNLLTVEERTKFENKANSFTDSLGRLADIGRFIAQIHSIETDWFDETRSDITKEVFGDHLEHVPNVDETHAWLYLARGVTFKGIIENLNNKDNCNKNTSDLWTKYRTTGAYTPQHPVTRRIVTIHGDFHPGNLVCKSDSANEDENDMNFRCIDTEICSVGCAVWDLMFCLATCCTTVTKPTRVENLEKKRAVIRGYLSAVELKKFFNENDECLSLSDENVDDIILDATLMILSGWLGGAGQLCAWEIDHEFTESNFDAAMAKWLFKIDLCQEFANVIRYGTDVSLKKTLVETRCEHVWRTAGFNDKLPKFMISRAAFYRDLQDELEKKMQLVDSNVEEETENTSTREVGNSNVNVRTTEETASNAFVIFAGPRLKDDMNKNNLVVQAVSEKCDRLNLGELCVDLDTEDEQSTNKNKKSENIRHFNFEKALARRATPYQQWIFVDTEYGIKIQNVGTGKFLHADAFHSFMKLGQPSALAAAEVFLKSDGKEDNDSINAQHWLLDFDFQEEQLKTEKGLCHESKLTEEETKKMLQEGKDFLVALKSKSLHPTVYSNECVIRQKFTGKALDVNFWKVNTPGTGVNLNHLHSGGEGNIVRMVFCSNDFTNPPSDEFTNHQVAVMLHYAQLINDFIKHRIPPTFTPLPNAPLNKDFEDNNVRFRICPGIDRNVCLSYRSDGYTGDKFEIYLARKIVKQNKDHVLEKDDDDQFSQMIAKFLE